MSPKNIIVYCENDSHVTLQCIFRIFLLVRHILHHGMRNGNYSNPRDSQNNGISTRARAQ
jgi:hypothetical protein